MKSIRPWTVQQHGELKQRDDGLWTVDDDVPGLKGAGRRMGIVKRDNGSLLFFNAIPVSDAVLAEIHGLGRPAQLVLPNHFHSLDAAAFAKKLEVAVFAPVPGVEVLKERVVCQPISALPADFSVQTFTVDGFVTHETAVVTRGTLLVGDLLTNVPHGGGMNGLLMRVVGFTGPKPRLPWPVQKRVGRDLGAVAALMQRLADVDGLKRIIPTHGAVIESDAPGVLRAVAATLRAK